MKATPEIIAELEGLKGFMCLHTTGEIYSLYDWEIISEKTLFGKPCEIVSKIWTEWSRHMGTPYRNLISTPDSWTIATIKNDRFRFLKVKKQLKDFNYEITKIENNVTY